MILDTCALLWLAEGGQMLSKEAAAQIRAASAVYISAITGFEIGVKYRAGKLKLPAVPSEWMHTILEHHDVGVIALELDVCVLSTELPAIHADPCDRMIIATARTHRLPVVTSDPRFKQYGIEVIW